VIDTKVLIDIGLWNKQAFEALIIGDLRKEQLESLCRIGIAQAEAQLKCLTVPLKGDKIN